MNNVPTIDPNLLGGTFSLETTKMLVQKVECIVGGVVVFRVLNINKTMSGDKHQREVVEKISIFYTSTWSFVVRIALFRLLDNTFKELETSSQVSGSLIKHPMKMIQTIATVMIAMKRKPVAKMLS